MASEEWRPVIIKVGEHGRRVEGTCVDLLEVGATEQLGKRLWLADGKLLAFILLCPFGEQLGDGVPKVPHQLHLARIIPHIDRSDASWLDDPAHLIEGALLVGHKIQDKAGDRDMYRMIFNGQRLRVAGPEVDPRVLDR